MANIGSFDVKKLQSEIGKSTFNIEIIFIKNTKVKITSIIPIIIIIIIIIIVLTFLRLY